MGSGEFLNINFFTALFTLVNTITLFLVLKKYLFQPVLKIIEDRQREIDDQYEKARQDREQAQSLRGEYEQKLAVAAETSERMVREAVARGASREEEILRRANADAAAILDKANADIAREKKKAVNDAKDEISGLAMEIAGKVVGRALTEADNARLVDEFIDGLGESV